MSISRWPKFYISIDGFFISNAPFVREQSQFYNRNMSTDRRISQKTSIFNGGWRGDEHQILIVDSLRVWHDSYILEYEGYNQRILPCKYVILDRYSLYLLIEIFLIIPRPHLWAISPDPPTCDDVTLWLLHDFCTQTRQMWRCDQL